VNPARTLITALALLLASCGGQAPSGQPHITEEDRAYGAEQHEQLLAELGGDYPGEQARYVTEVGDRLADAAGLHEQCVFTLVNSNVVNAFAVPGCYIYVTRGMLAVINSEAQLGSVLGHELGHIVGDHAHRQEQRSIWRALGVLAAQLTGSERLTRLASRAAQYFTLSYSREQEYEADELGIRYLKAAGYDPYEAAEMLSALARQEQFTADTRGNDDAKAIPEWSRSHPLTEHRVTRALEAARATGVADNELPAGIEPYLREIDGLPFGDDPEQGFVLGRRFAHPVMRIAFDAPSGFSLTNSPQAIRLDGPSGTVGEFGGGPLPDEGVDRFAEEIATAFVGEVPATLTRAEHESVNGVPAAIVQLAIQGENGTAHAYIAAYDGGDGKGYYFFLVSPPPADPSDAVMQLFRSFHLLSSEEAGELRPRVIRVVDAGPNDTLATMAGHMADTAPRELFLLLNGRKPDQPLRSGDRVKIVTFATER
jgi:predicted Zn-dependent protease